MPWRLCDWKDLGLQTMGMITNNMSENENSRLVVNPQVINYYVFYESDDLMSEHALSLERYHQEGRGIADYQYWVLLEADC